MQSNVVFAYPLHTPNWTKVEKNFLASSGRQSVYPHERIAVIEVRNQYELGKITALRFIEWAQDHPSGVIALTSGTTPEFFIKFLSYYKANWSKPQVQAELKSVGINSKKFPNTTNMRFVQIEEYFPIDPGHYKNCKNYVIRHYINVLGLKKENVLLMDAYSKGILAEKGLKVVFMNGKVDLSIMQHKPVSQLEGWQQQAIREARQFCAEYENKVRAWGGIDFFLGSLSYAGHLGFNGPGTPTNSKTAIVKLDYRSAANAAKDLGGIEQARGKVALTIGLGTMTIKPNAVMIVIANGEAKAAMVRDAVENAPNLKYPATILQKFPNTRFYVNSGAAKLLNDRRTEDIIVKSKHGWSRQLIDEVIIEIALAERKAITDLTNIDLLKHERGRLLLQSPPKPLPAMLVDVKNSIIANINKGLKLNMLKGNKILHTGPHHDDIMLGYYPLFDTFVRKYQNYFAHITSGFNSVSDSYILNTINKASDWWLNKEGQDIINGSYTKTINKFRNYFARQDIEQMDLLNTTLTLKHLVSIYDIKNIDQLKNTIRWLKDDYFPGKNPGDLDDQKIKLLKGMIRESEADRMLSLKNIPLQNIVHLRSSFYKGKEFTKTPRIASDVLPFLKVYNSIKPDILTVNDDPQSAPPTTNYKALQIIAQALRNKDAVNKNDLQIFGYRNVWFRYKVQEANVYVPVSEKSIAMHKQVFMSTFNTQRTASFPSPFYEGDFSVITATIQKEQLADLKILLGESYFTNNPNLEIKHAVGFIFLNQMNLDQFFQRAEDLQQAATLEESFETAKKVAKNSQK